MNKEQFISLLRSYKEEMRCAIEDAEYELEVDYSYDWDREDLISACDGFACGRDNAIYRMRDALEMMEGDLEEFERRNKNAIEEKQSDTVVLSKLDLLDS